MRVDDFEVNHVNRAARATNDARVLRVADLGADLFFHLDLVPVGENDDARIFLVLVGDDQFGDDQKNPRGPAENQRVILFDDERAPFAQLFELVLQAARQDADEQADDEDAADRHHEHQGAVLPPRVARERARVHRTHQALPKGFGGAEGLRFLPFRGVGRDARQQKNGSRRDDYQEGSQAEPADQRDRAARQTFIEGVTQALTESDCSHVLSIARRGDKSKTVGPPTYRL